MRHLKYMHDIWVNFSYESLGHEVWEFWEWRKMDKIELFDQIPLIKVETSFLDHVENSMVDLPEQLLADIAGKSYMRFNHERNRMHEACVLCDGHQALVIYTKDENKPVYKSRLLPRQFQVAVELVEDYDPIHYDFTPIERTYTLESPDPRIFTGLLRREKILKRILLLAFSRKMNQSHSNSPEKLLWQLRYWYGEVKPDQQSEIAAITDTGVLFDLLREEIENGWSSQHETLCREWVKGDIELEDLYRGETKAVKQK